MLARLSGPGGLRCILAAVGPAVGIRDGKSDAHNGRPAFLSAAGIPSRLPFPQFASDSFGRSVVGHRERMRYLGLWGTEWSVARLRKQQRARQAEL